MRTISFSDQEPIAPLLELQSAYPNAAIYLSGSVTVDFPDEIKLPIQPDQYQTVSLSGAVVKMEYCGVEGAIAFGGASPIAFLKEQYAVGTVTAKIIQPIPEGF